MLVSWQTIVFIYFGISVPLGIWIFVLTTNTEKRLAKDGKIAKKEYQAIDNRFSF
jgi:hypothetical protein